MTVVQLSKAPIEQSVSPDDSAIALLWKLGLDSFDIAERLGVHESAVANRILHIRQKAWEQQR